MEHYIYKNRQKLRCGYTTGSCAAAAAKSCGCDAAVSVFLKEDRLNDAKRHFYCIWTCTMCKLHQAM